MRSLVVLSHAEGARHLALAPRITDQSTSRLVHGTELSTGWVDPRVGSRFFSFFVRLGWVHYIRSTEICKDYVNAFKARLDKLRLHLAVKLLVVLGWVGLGPNFPLVVGFVGSGQSADGLGWMGHTKWTHGKLCHST